MLRSEDVTDEEDVTVMEKYVEKFVKFYKSIFHHNNWYFWGFVFTEFLNFVILFVNFWLMDKFLDGKFWNYGSEVFEFEFKTPYKSTASNPYCKLFPLVTSRDYKNFGTGGGEQTANGLCLLNQNIINQKIYLVLWFWMIFLMYIIAPICTIYRIVTIFFDPIRSFLLIAQTGNITKAETRDSIREIVSKCHLGDWFVLYQLSRNVNMYFFRSFIKQLGKPHMLDRRNDRERLTNVSVATTIV